MNSKRKKFADGSFKTYYWAWKGGPPLHGEPGTPEFIASYNEAVRHRRSRHRPACCRRCYSAFRRAPNSSSASRRAPAATTSSR